MRFMADECVHLAIIGMLRSGGHDVCLASDIMPGATDEHVLAKAAEEDRILLTQDYDFGELVIRLQQASRGVVVVSPATIAPGESAARLIAVRISAMGQTLHNQFTIIDPDRTRQRPISPVGEPQ
jgi:predicted nuclease of predicted toxin-antitoxin system